LKFCNIDFKIVELIHVAANFKELVKFMHGGTIEHPFVQSEKFKFVTDVHARFHSSFELINF
jgi:hypothetical protein